MMWKILSFAVDFIFRCFETLRLPFDDVVGSRAWSPTYHAILIIDKYHLILIPKLSIQAVFRVHDRSIILAYVLFIFDVRSGK